MNYLIIYLFILYYIILPLYIVTCTVYTGVKCIVYDNKGITESCTFQRFGHLPGQALKLLVISQLSYVFLYNYNNYQWSFAKVWWRLLKIKLFLDFCINLTAWISPSFFYTYLSCIISNNSTNYDV